AVVVLVTKNQDLDGPWSKLGDSLAQSFSNLFVLTRRVWFSLSRCSLEMIDAAGNPSSLPGPKRLQRHIDRRAIEVCPRVRLEIRRRISLDQLQKNILKNIFGVLMVAGDGVSRAVHQPGMFPENLFKLGPQGFTRGRGCQ